MTVGVNFDPSGTYSLNNSAYDYSTSGAVNKSSINCVVTPTANTTQQFNAFVSQTTYNSNNNVSSGGWLTGCSAIMNTAGAGTHAKIVGTYSQMNHVGGNVTISLGHESAVATIGAATTVGNYAAYYVANSAAIPNIGNIVNFYSFACDHYNSKMKNSGTYLKTMDAAGAGVKLVEVGPSKHPGTVTSRYYGPYSYTGTLTGSAVTATVIYYVPFYNPQRATYTKIGFRVTAGVAGNARLGIYYAENGVPTNLIVQSGDLSTAAAGAVEATISQSLEAGMYFLAIQCSVAPSVNFCTLGGLGEITGMTTDNGGETTPFAGPTTYGALADPAPAISYSALSNQTVFLWLRK